MDDLSLRHIVGEDESSTHVKENQCKFSVGIFFLLVHCATHNYLEEDKTDCRR